MSKGPAVAGSVEVFKHRNEVSMAGKQTQRTQFKAEMKVRPEWPHTGKTSLYSRHFPRQQIHGFPLVWHPWVSFTSPLQQNPTVALKTSPIHQLFLKEVLRENQSILLESPTRISRAVRVQMTYKPPSFPEISGSLK